MCCMCIQESSSDESTKIYTREEIFIMETTISDFCTSFYIPSIQRLAFHLPLLCILGTHHCGELQHTDLKHCGLFQDLLCHHGYAERLFTRFAN